MLLFFNMTDRVGFWIFSFLLARDLGEIQFSFKGQYVRIGGFNSTSTKLQTDDVFDVVSFRDLLSNLLNMIMTTVLLQIPKQILIFG